MRHIFKPLSAAIPLRPAETEPGPVAREAQRRLNAAERFPAPQLAHWLLRAIRVLAAYLLLTLLMTWPLGAQLTKTLPDGGDGWQFMWNLWWVKTAVVDLHTSPFHTSLLYYPFGTNLYMDTLTPLLGMVSIPLQLLGVSLITIYNLLVLSSFVLAGYGTYLLVHYLTRVRSAAFVAGIIFAFCPYHFAHLLGQLNLISLQGLPFYILALYKTWGAVEPPLTDDTRQPPGRHPFLWAGLAGLFLALNAYIEWTYALFLILFTLGFVAWQVLVARRGPGWWGSALRLGLVGGISLLLTIPVLGPMLQEARTTTYAQMPLQNSVWLSSDSTDAFVPSTFHPLWRLTGPVLDSHYVGRAPAERIVFVGYTTLVLSIVGLRALRRRKHVLFWGCTALAGWIFSLGPILHVWGERFFLGQRIPLPYAGLYFLPFFNILRVPSRFMVLTMLALAVLVGYTLATGLREQPRWWPKRLRPVAGAWLSAGAGVLILFEYLAVPYPMLPLDYQLPFYQELAAEPGQFAILDLPLTPITIYEAYQTIHHHPIVGGYLSRQPPDPFVANLPVLQYLLPATAVDDPLATVAAQRGLADLRQAQVRYAIVHWWVLSPQERADLQTKLARLFPQVPARALADREMTVYSLAP
jgi:hypothetical protein